MNRLIMKIKYILATCKCDIKRNNKCKKNNCICNGGECQRTTDFEYSNKTMIDYIKKNIPPVFINRS